MIVTPLLFRQRVQENEDLPLPRVAIYGERLSKYLVVGLDNLQSPDTGEILEFRPLIALDEEASNILGYDVPTTAGYRTLNHQKALVAKGYRAAEFVSPHFFCALDKDAQPRAGKSEVDACLDIVKAYMEAAKKLGLPRPRLGYRKYMAKFVHVDLLPMLFEPFTKIVHPKSWPETDWQNLFGRTFTPNGQTPQSFFAATLRPGFSW